MEYLGLVCEEQPSAATLMIVWDESVVTQMAKMRGRRWNLKANDQKETNIFGFKVSSLFSLPFGCQELYIFLELLCYPVILRIPAISQGTFCLASPFQNGNS